jgi:hypothetical protein
MFLCDISLSVLLNDSLAIKGTSPKTPVERLNKAEKNLKKKKKKKKN